MNALLRRLRLDPYIVAIMTMVAIAAILPAKGVGKDLLELANLLITPPALLQNISLNSIR